MPYYNKYIKSAYLYGALRKFGYIYGIDYTTNNSKTKNKLLFTDYFIICNFAGFTSLFMFPFYLINDIKYAEIKMRNLNPKNYEILEIANNDISYSELFYNMHIKYI